MALIDFTRLISFKDWFNNTNTLGNAVGDPDGINADLGSNLVNAANVIQSDLGDITSIDAALRPNANESFVEAHNELANEIGRFRISEAEPQAYDMHPIAVFGSDSDLDAHGFVE